MVLLKFYNTQKKNWPNPFLTSGSVIGHTTSTTVRMWFRVSNPGEYLLIISKNPLGGIGIPQLNNQENSHSGSLDSASKSGRKTIIQRLTFGYDTDLTNIIDLKNLEPNTSYYYALFYNNKNRPWEMGHQEKLSFQTFPENPSEIVFGIYSCNFPYEGKELANLEMWEQFPVELAHANARFIIGAGNQIYVDGNEHFNIWNWLKKVKQNKPSIYDMVLWYRDIYRAYWGVEPIHKVLRSFTNYMVWNDHEILERWGTYTLEELSALLDTSWQLRNPDFNLNLTQQMFQAAKRVYQEYEHSHNPDSDPKAEEFDYEFNYGFGNFYVLDERYSYDFNRQELRILGLEQWGRLEKWINAQYSISSKIIFIVSAIPIVHFSTFAVNKLELGNLKITDEIRDNWEHESNWKERNKLLELVFNFSQETQRPVVFLSGNVYMGAAFKISHQQFPTAKVFQLTSSPICYGTTTKTNRRFLETTVKETGNMLDFPDNIPYQFQTLHLCRHNNFGIVQVKAKPDGNLSIIYDLFSSPMSANKQLTKTRIELD